MSELTWRRSSRERVIELSLGSVSQLFNSLDPSPFHERDLDHDAEKFLVSWAQEHPAGSRFRLILHFQRDPGMASGIRAAVNNYFDYRARQTRARLHQLLRRGRLTLLIGVAFLTLCLLVAEVIAESLHGTFPRLLQESLTIGGWVAMWNPIQIYLYEWWPLAAKVRLFRSMSQMQVEVRTTRALRAASDDRNHGDSVQKQP